MNRIIVCMAVAVLISGCAEWRKEPPNYITDREYLEYLKEEKKMRSHVDQVFRMLLWRKVIAGLHITREPTVEEWCRKRRGEYSGNTFCT